MRVIYCILFLVLYNTSFSQACCDSLRRCMYYGKILVDNIGYRDSLLAIRAKVIEILQRSNDILLDSIRRKNIILYNQNALLLEKDGIISFQRSKIVRMRIKNIILVSVVVVLTLLKL